MVGEHVDFTLGLSVELFGIEDAGDDGDFSCRNRVFVDCDREAFAGAGQLFNLQRFIRLVLHIEIDFDDFLPSIGFVCLEDGSENEIPDPINRLDNANSRIPFFDLGNGLFLCHRCRTLGGREPLVNHEVDDDPGDGNEEPRWKGKAGELLVFFNLSSHRCDDKHDDQGDIDHCKNDMRQQNREVNLAGSRILFRKGRVARAIVVGEVATQKHGRADEGSDHGLFVSLLFS